MPSFREQLADLVATQTIKMDRESFADSVEAMSLALGVLIAAGLKGNFKRLPTIMIATEEYIHNSVIAATHKYKAGLDAKGFDFKKINNV